MHIAGDGVLGIPQIKPKSAYAATSSVSQARRFCANYIVGLRLRAELSLFLFGRGQVVIHCVKQTVQEFPIVDVLD